MKNEKTRVPSPQTSQASLKPLSMPTLDDQIRSILEAESPREEETETSSDSEGVIPGGIVRPISPGVTSDAISQGRSLSRKRASIRLEFTMSDDNIEAEPGSDASWVVEQQNCTFFFESLEPKNVPRRALIKTFSPFVCAFTRSTTFPRRRLTYFGRPSTSSCNEWTAQASPGCTTAQSIFRPFHLPFFFFRFAHFFSWSNF